MSEYRSTGELFAARFPHVEPDWLEMVNSTLGQMKVLCQGNARMSTQWNGGSDAGTEWTFKVPKRPRYRKPIQ
jgi:hypothetical protein